jgi:hypothetical protein
VFLGKNERDARNVLGHGLAGDRALTPVVGRSEFLQMTKSVEQAQLWLAKKIPEWQQRHPFQPVAAAKVRPAPTPAPGKQD